MYFPRYEREREEPLEVHLLLHRVEESEPDEPADASAPLEQRPFHMTGLFGLLPGTDPSPIRIDGGWRRDTG